jgi:hypothetical protein
MFGAQSDQRSDTDGKVVKTIAADPAMSKRRVGP